IMKETNTQNSKFFSFQPFETLNSSTKRKDRTEKILCDTIALMNIKGGSLETYSDTCWVSIYNTTSSIVYVKPAIDKLIEEQADIFTNQEVYKIVYNIDDIFYTLCKRIASVFEPIKYAINILESHMVNLADCLIEIVQIAATLMRIPTSNDFRTLAIIAFNFHYQQFDIFLYLLTYFLYPNYHNCSLKKGTFRYICKLAVDYYKNLHYNEKECCELVNQLIKYKARVAA
ncbi:5329_t:CDS:2, partial [Cetraspora pellucida]